MKRLRYVAFLGIFSAGVLWGWCSRQTAPVANALPAQAESLAAPAPEPSSPTAKNVQPAVFSDRWRQALSQGNPFKRAREFAAIADGLSEAEIREALTVLPTLHIAESDDMLEELLVRWGEINPEAAIDYALKLPVKAGPASQAAIEGWAGKDPKSAEEWAAKYRGPFHDRIWRGVASAIAGNDPEHALVLVQNTGGWINNSLVDAIFSRWIENSPQTAASRAAQLLEGIQRRRSLDAVAKKWAELDPAATLDWLQTLKDGGYAPDQHFTFPAQPDLVTQVMQVWSNRDPEAADHWLQRVPDEQKKLGLARELVNARADEDPAAAAELAAKFFPAGKSRNDVMKDVAMRWQDSNAEITWIQGQSDPDLKRAMTDGMLRAFSFGGLKPEMIQPLFDLMNVYEGESKVKATERIVRSWSGSDPAAAAAWAEQSPPDPTIYGAIEQGWLRKDPVAATAWMDRQPDGSAKQQFLGAIGNYDIDTQTAIRWIGQITDQDARDKAWQNFAGNWLDRDFVAASAWLEAADLAPEVKQQLLQSHAH